MASMLAFALIQLGLEAAASAIAAEGVHGPPALPTPGGLNLEPAAQSAPNPARATLDRIALIAEHERRLLRESESDRQEVEPQEAEERRQIQEEGAERLKRLEAALREKRMRRARDEEEYLAQLEAQSSPRESSERESSERRRRNEARRAAYAAYPMVWLEWDDLRWAARWEAISDEERRRIDVRAAMLWVEPIRAREEWHRKWEEEEREREEKEREASRVALRVLRATAERTD